MFSKSFRRAFLFVMIFILFTVSFSLAQATGSVEMISSEKPGAKVSYPSLTGFPNTFMQDSVNQAIMTAGGIQGFLDLLGTYHEGMPGNLRVDSTAQNLASSSGGLLAVLIEAEGNLSFGPPSHRYTPLMFNLATGQPVQCGELFKDCDAAKATIEDKLEDTLGEELSNYLDTGDLFPFPMDRFLLTETGISFYYPEGSMVWLSGKSAFVHFLYHELGDLLNLEEGSLMSSLDLTGRLSHTQASKPAIEQAVAEGSLPGSPVRLGEDMEAVRSSYPLLHDPEGFIAGQKYQLEDDRFRGSWVLSEDGRTVTGLISRRMNLFGLTTGKTTEEEISQVLGAPQSAVDLTQEAASLYGVPAGKMLDYSFSGNQLFLFIDQNQVLSGIWLNQDKAA